MTNDSLVHLLAHLVATHDAPLRAQHVWHAHAIPAHTLPATRGRVAPCWRPAGALLTLSWCLPCTGDRCGAVESARTPCAESSGRCQAKEWKRRVACSMSGEVGDAKNMCLEADSAGARITSGTAPAFDMTSIGGTRS
eukprot:CAMPEP_0181211680 /NCGR_PEP_ID=MMETSP1096-20121128/23931_1 /TAXON_ID=156174 ORGANISM="Chrysochromulina ericina, Strain CCMP281" /NCGR_SAMPLE_ID=MMETSP1096 /ASSEMBLY_ACC=CAM_ASM_000453 /LENGTH=137 /DNA_ID=CAMNT_0023303129 /DNA_START=292 /DNA_END=706 /DNA_ORIENTATION=-